jgi:hypothetical protein
VTVNTISQAPIGISATSNPVCPDSTTTLTLQGGTLGYGASWVWSTNSSFTDNAGTGSSITVQPNQATTYYVRAQGGCGGNTSSASVLVSLVTPITITGPVSQSACNQLWTVLSVTAAGGGTGTFNYQWNRNGIKITDGANYKNTNNRMLQVLSSIYTAGDYTCSVDNGAGCCKNSNSATLSIEHSPLVVNVSPDQSSWTVCEGEWLAFYIELTGGSGNYSYQWYKDDEPLSPDEARFLDPYFHPLYIHNIIGSDAGRYNCKVYDIDNPGSCPIFSEHVPVTVNDVCP